MTSSRLVDMLGRTYGRLTVIARAGSDGGGRASWRCRCACGFEKVVRGENLRRGRSTSCGCLTRELAAALYLTRKPSLTPLSESARRARRPASPASLLDASQDRPVVPAKARVAVPVRALGATERAAIAAAVSAGKITRIERGEWPDASRPELLRGPLRRRAEHMRAMAERAV